MSALKKTLFLIGVGRSGTTLLQSMLHAHPEIQFSTETHFIKRYVRPEIEKGEYNRNNPEKLISALHKDTNLKDFAERISEVVREGLIDSGEQYLTVSVFKNLINGNEKIKYFGDKDPMNVNFLSAIKKGFSSAKIIHIIRDPRDVISSRIKSGWGKGKSTLWHTTEYKYSINKARSEGSRLFKDNYIEVRYESLLSETEFELKRICSFLDISFDKKMLSHFVFADSLLRQDEMSWKENVLKPVDKNKIGQWKNDLKLKQVTLIESILENEFIALGYPTVSTTSAVKKMYFNLLNGFLAPMFKMKFG
jgi:hypothetical protein